MMELQTGADTPPPGLLDPTTRYVLSGWVQDTQYPGCPSQVVLEDMTSGMRLRLRALPQADRPDEPPRFICHLRQGLTPGSLIQGFISETGEPLAESPQAVSAQESTLALQSQRYDYLVYYNAKSACTWLRGLFIFLHEEEAQAPVNLHDLGSKLRPDPQNLPATALAVVRNPVARWISCFLDKVVSWFYEPSISRALPLLRWRFGEETGRYPEFNFLDFLDYLNAPTYPADEHFWPQPIYLPHVQIARVESLEWDLLAFYADHRPELLSKVERFIQVGQGMRNISRNTALSPHILYQDADTLGIGELAQLLDSGLGIAPESLLTERSLPRLDLLTRAEREAYGYPLYP